MTAPLFDAWTPVNALSVAVLALVSVERLAELALARRNTQRLLSQGAVEVGRGHYPAMVLLHAAWLLGLWIAAPTRAASLPLLAAFALLQAGRAWVLVTLRQRWTTRIIVLPGAPLVRTGPYRFVRHPNYLIVAGEIFVLPLAFGLVTFALIFTAFNAIILTVRIREEEVALSRSPARERVPQ